MSLTALAAPTQNPRQRSKTRNARHSSPYYLIRATARIITKALIALAVLATLAAPSLITGPF